MEQKASESGGNNQAMNAFYRDQFKNAISSVERQMMPPAARHGASPPPNHAQPLGSYGGAAPVSRYASGPVIPPPSEAAVPPVRRNIPNYSRFQSQHQNFNQPAPPPQQYGSAVTPIASNVVTTAGGADFYKAATSSELNGARCFCGGVGGQSGKVVECTKCALRVHAKCHQLITVRPTLRSPRLNPWCVVADKLNVRLVKDVGRVALRAMPCRDFRSFLHDQTHGAGAELRALHACIERYAA
jgi:hypothetical protein